MLLIEGMTDQRTNSNVNLTHSTRKEGSRTVHVLSLYKPKPSAGPLAGELIARYVLTEEMAKELKAHL
jgi:hypothetical protein